MWHPHWFSGSNRIAREKVVRIDPQCFTQGRCLAHHVGRNAVSRSLPAWLLRPRPLSGPPGGDDPSCVPPLKITKFEQEVLYKHGLAQVGFSFSFALLSQLHRFFSC